MLRVKCRSQTAFAILQDDIAAALHCRLLVANPQMTANLRRQSSGLAWLVAFERMEPVARCESTAM